MNLHFGNGLQLRFQQTDGSDKGLKLILGILRVHVDFGLYYADFGLHADSDFGLHVDFGLGFQSHRGLVRFLRRQYQLFQNGFHHLRL